MGLGVLFKLNLRYYRRHGVLSLLCLLGIALGVGIIVAVELINNSALASFASSVDFLSGKSTHSIISEYDRIDEDLFRRVWAHPEVTAASPVVEAPAATKETGSEPIRFVGLDPLLDEQFRSLTPSQGDEREFVAFLTGRPPRVYLSADLMKRFDLKPGDPLTLSVAGVRKEIRILGALPGSQGSGPGENTAALDIAAAQDLFGRTGYLDRIDIIAADGVDTLRDALPSGLRITDRGERKAVLTSMLYSFQLNLAAMSLLALFVGIFLIYNFSMFSVLSRREEMSLLLTLGTDRRNLVGAFLLEALLMGAVGSLIGIAFGWMTAWFSIERVSASISEIYFYVRAEGVHLTRMVVLRGFAVGFAATLIGTALPALEIAFTPPILGMKRRTIEDRAHGLKGMLFVGGLILCAFSGAAAWASRYSIYWGFASAFGLTLAFAFFTPSILAPSTHHLARWLKKGLGSLEGFLAARTIKASLSRTSIAVAALAVALAMTIGVDTMIHSFKESVRNWLDYSLQGDLYISPSTTKWAHPLPETLVENAGRLPNVAAVERFSSHEIYLEGRPVRLRVIDADVLKKRGRFHFIQGDATAWDELIDGDVFVSESLAYRFRVGKGDTITLSSPNGKRAFRIAAVTRDYSSDQGAMHMDWGTYRTFWNDDRVQSMALFLEPGASPNDVRAELTRMFPGLDRTVVSNTRMKEDILKIFDKTFAPTATLKGVSLVVGLLGVATALMAILMERSREVTVLGYLGLTSWETARLNGWQAVIMGVMAFAVSVVCGIVLTYIIVYAINYRSFGWSIDIFMNPWVFIKTFALTMAACLASSVYPSYKLITSQRRAALDEE